MLLLSAGEALTGSIGQTLKNLVGTSQAKVAFIATASEVVENTDYVDRDRIRLHELGFELIEIDLKRPEEFSHLDDCDVIFVEGGNTFYLLDQVRKSQFNKKLKELLKKGKIYVGISAGSILVGPSIEVSKYGDKNLHGVKDFKGLKLIPFNITPHFNEDSLTGKAEVIERETLESGMPLVALKDDQAILVQDKQYSILGPGELYLWNLPNGLWQIEIGL